MATSAAAAHGREVFEAAEDDFVHTGQSDIRLDVWGKSVVVGLAVAAPAAVLGLTAKLRPIDPVARSRWDEEVLFQVALPAVIWCIVANKVTGTVSYSFGTDMLLESNSDIKEAVRSNMMTIGVVLSLVLSIVIGMLQADLAFENECVRLAMWYRMLLVFSIEACVKGILMSCFFLVYMEPLGPSAAKAFSIDNVNYLGEPFAGVVLSLTYFLCAMTLWMFGVDGLLVGLVITAVFAYTIIRSVVVLMYMSLWQNPEVERETRKRREDMLSGLYQVVARKSDDAVTLHSLATSPSAQTAGEVVTQKSDAAAAPAQSSVRTSPQASEPMDADSPLAPLLAVTTSACAQTVTEECDFTHTGQSDIRLDLWGQSVVVGLLIAAPALVIGLTSKLSPIGIAGTDGREFVVGWQICLPAFLWGVFTNRARAKKAYDFGKDMLMENNSEIKAAARSNLTTVGVVLSLVLSIAMAMLQNDLPFESASVRLAMLYRITLVYSIESCVQGLLMSCFILVYMEPLSPSSAKAFCIDNVNYLGEPFAGVVFCLAYFLGAMTLWMFGVYGYFLGSFMTCVFAYTVIRSFVVLLYMGCWKNPEVSSVTRKRRELLFASLYQVAGSRPNEQYRTPGSEGADSAVESD